VSSPLRVGFIGLGNMGARIVTLMLEAGVATTLWARRESSLVPFEGTAATVAESPAELAAGSDVVGICVWDEHDVDEVVLGERGVIAGVRPGSVIAIHSTISRHACVRLAAAVTPRGAHLIDAPVSQGSSTPKVLVMAGGDSSVVEACRAVFETFGDPVLHLGPLGSGQIAKLVNNTLLAASIGLADDALDLGAALGLDRVALGTALSCGSSKGTWSTFLAPLPRLSGGRTGEWAKKDTGLMLDTVRDAGVDSDRAVLALGARGADLVTKKLT